MALAASSVPNDLEPYWMPFTANRAFKKRPRLIVGAKDMHYIASDGRKLIDGAAGLATLDVYRDEGLFERARKLEKPWAQASGCAE